MKNKLRNLFVFSAILILLIGCTKQVMDMDEKAMDQKAYERLISKLEEKGFSVIADDVEESILQGQRKWLTLNDRENISVYFYETDKEMEEDAAYIHASGLSYHNKDKSVEISWSSLPHFYKTDNIIVLYVGESNEMISALEELIGHQFAGYVGE